MWYGSTTVKVAVMIVPLYTIYPPVAAVASLTETQFKLTPHMQSQRLTYINAGIQQHLQKLYNTNKASLKAAHWVIKPETGTYDEPSPSRLNSPKPGKEHGRMPAGIPVTCSPSKSDDVARGYDGDGGGDDRPPPYQLPTGCGGYLGNRATREYPSLIHTFYVTHTVNGIFTRDEDRAIYEMLRLQALGSNTPSGVPYTEEEINALAQKGKQRGTFPVLVAYCRDGPHMSSFLPRLNYESTLEFGNASGSGGCGDDEMAGDKDGSEDEEDEEDGDS
nr:hypothetical protein [Tanacetum cinerariifolium]